MQRTLHSLRFWTPQGSRHAGVGCFSPSSTDRLLPRTSQNSSYEHFIDGTSANRLSRKFVLRGSLAALQSSYSISLEGKHSLPLCRSEDGTYDMAVPVLLLVHVVREMCRVPDHHVLVANALPVDEAADLSWSIRL